MIGSAPLPPSVRSAPEPPAMQMKLLLELLGCRYTYFALMLLGAALFGFFLLEENALERVNARYTPVPCTITSSEVIEKTHSTRRGIRRSYHFAVKYHYEVNGKVYVSTKYRHGDQG